MHPAAGAGRAGAAARPISQLRRDHFLPEGKLTHPDPRQGAEGGLSEPQLPPAAEDSARLPSVAEQPVDLPEKQRGVSWATGREDPTDRIKSAGQEEQPVEPVSGGSRPGGERNVEGPVDGLVDSLGRSAGAQLRINQEQKRCRLW
ncbi:hypothetical protein NDU88_004454 [Pleurodeles waltl]|uniref:Uncharacterized protein n=1 Tax=Pleurodeles waltl TaxID=8319 RepID=A0AAV7VK23_PLEWA|nr:hypothetical protein NDU88_004454 [Pleurodeles waltl]